MPTSVWASSGTAEKKKATLSMALQRAMRSRCRRMIEGTGPMYRGEVTSQGLLVNGKPRDVDVERVIDPESHDPGEVHPFGRCAVHALTVDSEVHLLGVLFG